MRGYGIQRAIDWVGLAEKEPGLPLKGSRIDWSSPDARYLAARASLRHDFGIRGWDMPRRGRLIPCIPNRLAYLYWVHDLIVTNDASMKKCLDVGTGCSAVYALLGRTVFGWDVSIAESDAEALAWAKRNVEAFPEIRFLRGDDECFDFCVCNPPFFDVDDAPSEAGTARETRFRGGEVEFVLRHVVPVNAAWHTTLLGHKASVKPLVAALKRRGYRDVSHAALAVGRSARWAVAWRKLHWTISTPREDSSRLVDFLARNNFIAERREDSYLEEDELPSKRHRLCYHRDGVKARYDATSSSLTLTTDTNVALLNKLKQAAPGEIERTNRRWRRLVGKKRERPLF